jgi:hypothetical protein
MILENPHDGVKQFRWFFIGRGPPKVFKLALGRVLAAEAGDDFLAKSGVGPIERDDAGGGSAACGVLAAIKQ